MSTLAIIPARGGSKRVPDKNLRPFLGTPLIAWTIRFARGIGLFDHIVVSTDSERIAAVARHEGIDVPWLRPPELSSDTAGSVEMAIHAIEQEALARRRFKNIALLQPTSPVRKTERWREAFDRLEGDGASAAVGVVPAANHPFHTYALEDGARMKSFVGGDTSRTRLRSQDLPPAYAIAGNLYLIRIQTLVADKTFFPANTAGIVCDDPCETFDIDTIADWIAAEALAAFYEHKT